MPKTSETGTAGLSSTDKDWQQLSTTNYSGRTLAILPVYQALEPKKPKEKTLVFYAGAASGGVWRSEDEGKSWKPTDDLMPYLSIGSLVADPKDPSGKTIYAGTGEGIYAQMGFDNNHNPKGGGIFKTTDGKSWTQIEDTALSVDEAFSAVNRLVFSADSKTLVATTNGGIFYSNDAKHEIWTRAQLNSKRGRLQAEKAELKGPAKVHTSHSGYDGEGFVSLESKESEVIFSVDIAFASNYDMKIRYAAGTHGGDGDRRISLIVNDGESDQLILAQTGSWTNWGTTSRTTIKLNKGLNTIKLQVNKEDTGSVNIDFIDLFGEKNGYYSDHKERQLPIETVSEMDVPVRSLDAHPTNKHFFIAGGFRNGKAYYSRDAGKTWNAFTRAESNGTAPNKSSCVDVCFAQTKLKATDQDVPAYMVFVNPDSETHQLWGFLNDITGKLRFKGNVEGIAGYIASNFQSCIWAGDPEDANLIVVGGQYISKSLDGGKTFKRIDKHESTGAIYPHADHQVIVSDPRYGMEETEGNGNKYRIWVGNDGGIYTTDNIRTLEAHEEGVDTGAKGNWEKRNNGYYITQYYYGTGNPELGIVIAGSQDNGTHAFCKDEKDEWSWQEKISFGDGGALGINPKLHTEGSEKLYYCYTSLQNLSIYRLKLNQAKKSWTIVQKGIQPPLNDENTSFIAPVKIDPKDGNVLYAGAQSLWRTMNAVGNRNFTLIINGSDKTNHIFPLTGSWNIWDIKTINVALNAGVNTIEFKAEEGDSAYVNIAQIKVGGETIKADDSDKVETTGNARVVNTSSSETGDSFKTIGYMKSLGDSVKFEINIDKANSNLEVTFSAGKDGNNKNHIAWKPIAPKLASNAYITSIAIGSTDSSQASANLSDLILLGYSSGEIFYSEDVNKTDDQITEAIPTWNNITPEDVKTDHKRMCKFVAIVAESDKRVFYAGYAGYTTDNLKRSIDQGKKWTSISKGLPEVPVNCITVHPTNKEWLYIGTVFGLFASEDGGKNWSQSNVAPANVSVTDLFWMGLELFVVTYGRDIFHYDFSS